MGRVAGSGHPGADTKPPALTEQAVADNEIACGKRDLLALLEHRDRIGGRGRQPARRRASEPDPERRRREHGRHQADHQPGGLALGALYIA
jgi:hypothetical protein